MSVAEAIVQRLEQAVQELIAVTDGLDARLYNLPSEDAWSPMQNLAHVAEFLPFWAVRARDLAAGRYAPDQPFNRTPDEWNQRANAVAEHANDELNITLERLRRALSEATAALREITDAGWQRSGILESGNPPMTVEALVEQRLIGHVRAHVRQASEAASSAPTPE